MTMNPLKITGDTENIFRNLTAFEQHYAGAALNASSYVALMNSLLRTSRDVEALCGILIRDPLTGLDVDVENLFKEVKLGVNVYTVDQGFSRAILNWKREQEIYDSKIFRVPSHIRDLEPNAYEPTTISFGPYHHSEKRLQAMKRHKRRYRNKLLKRCNGKNWEGCLEAVRKIADLARRYYEEPLNLDHDVDFIEMMTLDGCFQIEFITSENPDDVDYDILSAVERDIMLLENQVPFIVLREISR